MSRGDENKATLVLTFTTLGVIALAVFFVKFTKIIPISVLFIITMLLEEFLIVPLFNIYLFKFYKQPLQLKIEAFAPLWNYVMSSDLMVASLISFILTVLIGLSCLVPDIYAIFGTTFMLKVDTFIPNIFTLLLLISNLLVGIGLYKNCLEIKQVYFDLFCSSTEQSESVLSKIYNCVPFLDIIMLSMPVFRMIPLITNIEKLISLDKFNFNVNNMRG